MSAPDYLPSGLGTPADVERRQCEANQKKLTRQLGLPEDASDAEVTARLKVINDRQLTIQLGLPNTASPQELKAQLRAEQRARILRMLGLKPDEEGMIGKKLLEEYVKALKREAVGTDVPTDTVLLAERAQQGYDLDHLTVGGKEYEKAEVRRVVTKLRSILGMQTIDSDFHRIWKRLKEVVKGI